MPQVSPRLSSSPHPAFHLSSQTMSKVMDSEVNATLGKLKPSGTVKPTMGRGPRRSAPGLGHVFIEDASKHRSLKWVLSHIHTV